MSGFLSWCMVFALRTDGCVYTTSAAVLHDLAFLFCLSVERSQGIVLLEVPSLCLPFVFGFPAPDEKKKGAVY